MRSSHGLVALRNWVARHKVKQMDICRATGLSPSMVCRILKGENKISLRSAVRLAGYTGLPVENLANPQFVLIVRKLEDVA